MKQREDEEQARPEYQKKGKGVTGRNDNVTESVDEEEQKDGEEEEVEHRKTEKEKV